MRDCQKCGSDDVRREDFYADVEYSVYCNECNHYIGTWAYGYWLENEDGETD